MTGLTISIGRVISCLTRAFKSPDDSLGGLLMQGSPTSPGPLIILAHVGTTAIFRRDASAYAAS